MILNPKPLLWSMPDLTAISEPQICPYAKLYRLFCATPKRLCHDCFIRQEGRTTHGMTSARAGRVVRVCDRCHTPIEDVDTMLYCIIRDRQGDYIADMELCPLCQQELTDWIEGKDFVRNSEYDEPIKAEQET